MKKQTIRRGFYQVASKSEIVSSTIGLAGASYQSSTISHKSIDGRSELPSEIFGFILSFLPVFEQYRVLISSNEFIFFLATLEVCYSRPRAGATLFWLFNEQAIITAVKAGRGFSTEALRHLWAAAMEYLALRKELLNRRPSSHRIDLSFATKKSLTSTESTESHQLKLHGLELLWSFKNVVNLSLSGLLVSDVSRLSGFVYLTHLDLSSTLVDDVYPLRDLVALRMLNLENTSVDDIHDECHR